MLSSRGHRIERCSCIYAVLLNTIILFQVLKTVLQIVPSMPRVRQIIVDFKKAVWSAIRKIFTEVRIHVRAKYLCLCK